MWASTCSWGHCVCSCMCVYAWLLPHMQMTWGNVGLFLVFVCDHSVFVYVCRFFMFIFRAEEVWRDGRHVFISCSVTTGISYGSAFTQIRGTCNLLELFHFQVLETFSPPHFVYYFSEQLLCKLNVAEPKHCIFYITYFTSKSIIKKIKKIKKHWFWKSVKQPGQYKVNSV